MILPRTPGNYPVSHSKSLRGKNLRSNHCSPLLGSRTFRLRLGRDRSGISQQQAAWYGEGNTSRLLGGERQYNGSIQAMKSLSRLAGQIGGVEIVGLDPLFFLGCAGVILVGVLIGLLPIPRVSPLVDKRPKATSVWALNAG